MKVLILNGSPHKKGNTYFIAEKIKEVYAFESDTCYAYDIKDPCRDCKKCFEGESCSIEDEFTQILANIDTYDAIVVATPLYYNQPTGSMLSLLSRFQFFYGTNKKPKEKKAVIVVTGGGGSVVNSADAEKTLRIALMSVNAKVTAYIRSLNTDSIKAWDDETLTEQIRALDDIIF